MAEQGSFVQYLPCRAVENFEVTKQTILYHKQNQKQELKL